MPMIICSICQTENHHERAECLLCGAFLEQAEESHQSTETAPASKLTDHKGDEALATVDPIDSPVEHILGDLLEKKDQRDAIPPTTSEQVVANAQISLSEQSRYNLSSLPQYAVDSVFQSDRILFANQSLHTPDQVTRSPEQSVPQISSQSMSQEGMEQPAPGTLCLIVYHNRRPAYYFPVMYDETLIGRKDPTSNAYPDLDVTPFDTELAISRKHCFLYREKDEYFIYSISNSGTQVNQEMIEIGTKKHLKEGDVIILSGRLAIRFARMPPTN